MLLLQALKSSKQSTRAKSRSTKKSFNQHAAQLSRSNKSQSTKELLEKRPPASSVDASPQRQINQNSRNGNGHDSGPIDLRISKKTTNKDAA